MDIENNPEENNINKSPFVIQGESVNLSQYLLARIFGSFILKITKKLGWIGTVGLLSAVCAVRGLYGMLVYHKNFWWEFLHPFFLFLGGFFIIGALYLLGKRFPRIIGAICRFF